MRIFKMTRTVLEKRFFNPRMGLSQAKRILKSIKIEDSYKPNFDPNDKKYDNMLIERKKIQEEYIKFKNIHSNYKGCTTLKSRVIT